MALNPHDNLCRFAFRTQVHAAGWLRSVLPPPLAGAVVWGTLRPWTPSLGSRDLRLHHADLLFVAELRNGASVFVLIEHKSAVDPGLERQLLRYALHLGQQDGAAPSGRPTLVLPVLLHHGERAWPTAPAATAHPDLQDLAPEAATLLAGLQPGVRYLCDDLSCRSEADLRRPGLTPFAQLTLLCLQFLRGRDDAEVLAAIERWADLLRAVDRGRGGQAALEALSFYFLYVTELPPQQIAAAFAEALQRRAEEFLMSTAEKLIAQGRDEGLRRGKAEGRAEGKAEGRTAMLERLLTARFGPLPPAAGERIRRGSEEELDRWAIAALDAPTLAAVLAAP